MAQDCEFGWIEMPVAVAIGQGKLAVKVTLSLVAGVDTITIGVPDVGPARRQRVFCGPGPMGGVASWNGLC